MSFIVSTKHEMYNVLFSTHYAPINIIHRSVVLSLTLSVCFYVSQFLVLLILFWLYGLHFNLAPIAPLGTAWLQLNVVNR